MTETGVVQGGPSWDVRRSRRVAAVCLVVGGALLGVTLGVRDGSWQFYVAGVVLAAVWVAGFVLAKSPPVVRGAGRHDALLGALVGAGMFGVFVLGKWAASRLGVLDAQVAELLRTADAGPRPAVICLALVNAVAEELFFRGSLITVTPRRWQVVAGVVPYAAVTAFSGNAALVVAAVVMGAVWSVLRVVRRNLVASIVCHLVWGTLMIVALPR